MKQNENGFSLIEVLIALAIFAVASVGLSASLLSTIGANRFSKETSEAAVIAQDKIEDFRSLVNFPSSGNDTVGVYTRTWTVSSGPTTGTREVTVTVTWTTPGSRQVQFKSILAL